MSHAKLNRRSIGEFAGMEWALLGTVCATIESLVGEISAAMPENLKPLYIDESHGGESQNHFSKLVKNGESAKIENTLAWEKPLYRSVLLEQNWALVNGNHFKAARQIVVWDEGKKDSLLRKLDRLDHVDMILLKSDTAFPEEIRAKMNPDTLVWKWSERQRLADWFLQELNRHKPKLNGLVLMGGSSSRMKSDKAQIEYYGKPQYLRAQELLREVCEKVFVSTAQPMDLPENVDQIVDRFSGLGPLGGILSAFQNNPDAAWLVLAIDLPGVGSSDLEKLCTHRSFGHYATAFHNPETGFPDPLCTIYEPKAYPALLQLLAQGLSCPRKMLINYPCKVVEAANAEVLRNINHPHEREAFMQTLKK